METNDRGRGRRDASTRGGRVPGDGVLRPALARGAANRRLLPASALRVLELRPRRAFLPLGVEDEGLRGQPVDLRVDAAVEGADRSARDSLDGLAELADARVLKEDPGVAQALVLTHLDEVAFS